MLELCCEYLSVRCIWLYHITYEFRSASTLYSLPECQGTSCSKQLPYLKFKISRIPLLSLERQIWHSFLRARSSLSFMQTIDCLFTQNLVRDMIVTYVEKQDTSSKLPVTSSNPCVIGSNLRVTSSDLLVTSSNPRVRRPEARVIKLKALVGG